MILELLYRSTLHERPSTATSSQAEKRVNSDNLTSTSTVTQQPTRHESGNEYAYLRAHDHWSKLSLASRRTAARNEKNYLKMVIRAEPGNSS